MTERLLGLGLVLLGLAMDIGFALYLGHRLGRGEKARVVSDPSRTPTVEIPCVPTVPFTRAHEIVMMLPPVHSHRYRSGRASIPQQRALTAETRQFELPRGL